MNKIKDYLMESDFESERLNIKTDRNETLKQLLQTGFDQLKNGSSIVDAGCGGGYVAEVMANQLANSKKSAVLSLIDMSAARIKTAKDLFKKSQGVSLQFIESSLEKIPLPDNSQDYVFCRFVFEYLKEPMKVFSELLRICRVGGKIVVGDLDNNCLSHYPLSSELESQLFEISKNVFENKMLDPWIGRKLYAFFYQKKLSKIRVHINAHHLFYGKLPEKDLQNWTAKLDQLAKLQEQGLRLSFDIKDFKSKFLKFLSSEDRFSYTPIILVEGIKCDK